MHNSPRLSSLMAAVNEYEQEKCMYLALVQIRQPHPRLATTVCQQHHCFHRDSSSSP